MIVRAILSSLGGRLVLVVLSIGVSLVLGEGVLRIALNPSDFLHATLVQDPILGKRIQPLTTGHDALGFRNRDVPSHAEVVAIGDSNTYGVGVPREGSWPHQLGMLLGDSVYNMGLGGFGPLQYLHLAQVIAKPMKPRAWVVGFYFGNDLMDSYYLAHGIPHWKDWRLSASPSGTTTTEFDEAGMAEPKKRFASLRNWLSRHSLLYSVLRATVFQRMASLEREQMLSQSKPDVQWAWSDPAKANVRTVFTPQVRLAAVDIENAPVREGLQISKRAMAAIQTEADQKGVKLIVVLIPTKERAYCAQLKVSAARLPLSHARLCDAETKTKAEFMQTLDKHGIYTIDTTAALEAKIAQHVQLYSVDSDSHLQTAGYGVVAQLVADAIRVHAPKP